MTPNDSACEGRNRASEPGSEMIAFWVVVALVFVSRLPFLGAGHGTDPDAWALVDAARSICETGQYTASRLPGYPLPELIGALLWRGGPLVLNGCTALFSAWAAASFIRSAKVLGSADPLLAGLALAMTPVVFVNSVNSMDTVWALALILASHHAVLVGRRGRGFCSAWRSVAG